MIAVIRPPVVDPGTLDDVDTAVLRDTPARHPARNPRIKDNGRSALTLDEGLQAMTTCVDQLKCRRLPVDSGCESRAITAAAEVRTIRRIYQLLPSLNEHGDAF